MSSVQGVPGVPGVQNVPGVPSSLSGHDGIDTTVTPLTITSSVSLAPAYECYPNGPLFGYTATGVPIECPWCNRDYAWEHIPDSTSTICDGHYQVEMLKIQRRRH